MAKRGPGRPLNPGPSITPKSNIEVPDELIKNFVVEAIDENLLKELSEAQLQNVVNTLKGGLFKVTGEFASPNASAFYTGEYADLKGVQVAFDFEKAWQDPVKYIKGLPLDYIRGILQQGDIEALVEKQVLAHVMKEGYLKKASGAAGETLLATGNGLKILQEERHSTGPAAGRVSKITGIDGLQAYKGLSDTITKWVDDNQSLGRRAGAVAAVEDAVHDVLSLELVGHSDFKKNDAAQAAAIEAAIAGAADLDRFVKGYLSDSQFKAKYRKSLFTDSRGRSYTVEDLIDHSSLGGLNYSHISLSNSYTRRKVLKSITGKGASKNRSILKVKQAIQSDSAHFGFSSSAAIDDIFSQIKDDMSMSDFLDKVAPAMLFDRKGRGRATARDVVLFKQIYGEVVSSASGSLNAIRTHMEKEIYGDYRNIVQAIVNKVPSSERGKVEQRVKSALDLKQYVKLRADVQSAEEFLTAVSKGNVLTNYFYFGRYGEGAPEFIQQIEGTIKKIKIGRNITIGDLQNKATSLRDKQLQRLGFSGKGSENPGLFGFFSNTHKVSLDQVNPGGRKVVYDISGAKHELQLYKSGKTFENMWQINDRFNKDIFYWRGAEVIVKAKDFASLPGTLDGIRDMAESYVKWASVNRAGVGVDINVLHRAFENFYRNPGSLSPSSPFFAYVDPSKVPNIINSFKSTFKTLEKYEDVVDPADFLSFLEDIGDISGGNGLIGGSRGAYTLKRYLPLLPSIAQKLTQIQTKLLSAFEQKILENTVFRLPGNSLYRGLWDLYNPRHGPIKTAQSLMNKRWFQLLTKPISKLSGFFTNTKAGGAIWSVAKKLLPAALTGPQAAVVFVAIVVARLSKGLINGAKNFMRGDLLAFFKEIRYIIDDLVYKPLKFFGRIILYIFITVFLFFWIFILPSTTGSVAQYDRDYSLDAYLGTLYDDPLMACKTDFKGEVGVLFVSALDPDPTPTVETSCFGWRKITVDGVTKYGFHKGIDYGLPLGTPIVSPIRGVSTVIFAGWNNSGYGNLAILKDNRSETYVLLAHMDTILVTKGQEVSHRQQVGTVGNTGYSTGPHLHYEIRMGGSSISHAVNPCAIFSCQSKCSSFSGENLNGKGGCYTDYAP